MRSIGSALALVLVCSSFGPACGNSIVIDDPPSPLTPSTTRTIRGRLADQPPSTFVRAYVDGTFVAADRGADGIFTLTAPRDVAIGLEVVVDNDGQSIVGDIGYPIARAQAASDALPQDGEAVVRSAPRSTSTLLPGTEDIWLGDVTVTTLEVRACAAAMGAAEDCPPTTTAQASASENPLEQNDHDGDGVADLDDPDALWLLLGAAAGDPAP